MDNRLLYLAFANLDLEDRASVIHELKARGVNTTQLLFRFSQENSQRLELSEIVDGLHDYARENL